MNRKELVEAILKNKELNHLTKKDADNFIATFLDTVKKSVKKGNDVSLVGFGTFTKVKRAARMQIIFIQKMLIQHLLNLIQNQNLMEKMIFRWQQLSI